MQSSKISIITINYNNAVGLKKTVDSVVKQNFKDFEYIVIDGGSTDGSKNIIEENAANINYWVSESDKGIYNAMNKGIKAATGDYILFLNSGDVFYNNEVLGLVNPQLNSGDIITGNLNMYDEGKTFVVNSREKVTFKDLFQYSIDHPSTFIRREMFNLVGLYDENLKIVSDWKWFILAMAKYDASYKKIDVVISTFDMDGISSKTENRQKLIAERKNVLAKEFPFFIEDYRNLVNWEEDAKNYAKLRKSTWIRWGRKIGLMKNVKF